MKSAAIITSAVVPRLRRVRDFTLTVLAWATLLYLLVDFGRMVLYWLAIAVHGKHRQPVWLPGELWRDTLPFLQIAGLFVVWLLAFALVHWQVLTNRARSRRPPEPLDPDAAGRALGFSAESTAVLQSAAVVVVSPVRDDAGTERLVASTVEPEGRG